MCTASPTAPDRFDSSCCQTLFMKVLHRRDQIVPLLDRISVDLCNADYPARAITGVRLALEEAIVNAIQHGNNRDATKCVFVSFRVGAEQFVAQVQDEGAGFDPAAVPDPTLPENLVKPSGRGLLLMREFMTWIEFSAGGACVTMCKRRPN